MQNLTTLAHTLGIDGARAGLPAGTGYRVDVVPGAGIGFVAESGESYGHLLGYTPGAAEREIRRIAAAPVPTLPAGVEVRHVRPL